MTNCVSLTVNSSLSSGRSVYAVFNQINDFRAVLQIPNAAASVGGADRGMVHVRCGLAFQVPVVL